MTRVSAMAKYGAGLAPDKLLTALLSVVTVSSFEPCKVTEPLVAEALIAFE
jgi:hypothetical protein